MHNIFKLEGRIERLELGEAMLDALGGGTDKFITSSAILSGVSGSVSLGAQTVFLASKSKLLVDTMIMEVDGKICIGKFHRIYLKEGDYVVCVAKNIRNNVYELYSVLSPESGLLYMQVGMGGAIEPIKKSTKKGFYFLFVPSGLLTATLMLHNEGFNLNTLFFIAFILCLGYFTIYYLIQWASQPVFELSKVSEKVFEKYGFKDPENIYLLSARYTDKKERRFLESVYEYRRVIKEDPYPVGYIGTKKKK